MSRVKEFRFEEGGVLRLEALESGKLSIQLQARHLGEGMRFTSAAVVVDAEKAQEIATWLAGLEQQEEPNEQLG